MHMRLCPKIDREPIHSGRWRPFYTTADVRRWIRNGLSQVCCICNTFQTVCNTAPISTSENAVAQATEAFHFEECDTRDTRGLSWGRVAQDSLRRICLKCRRHIARTHQIPPFAWTFLRQPAVPSCLSNLNRVEQQLIARGTAQHKVLLLPREEQSGTVGNCCSYLLQEPRRF